MYIPAIETIVSRNAVQAISKELDRVSRVALDAMMDEIEETQELARSGYFVREAALREILLFQQRVTG